MDDVEQARRRVEGFVAEALAGVIQSPHHGSPREHAQRIGMAIEQFVDVKAARAIRKHNEEAVHGD